MSKLPPVITATIAKIPNFGVRELLPYKILPKNSASSSILIVTKDNKPDSDGCPSKSLGGNIPVAIKVWCKYGRPLTEEESALEYEKSVYVDYIRNLVNSNPDAPFLRYIGDDNGCSTVKSLAQYIGCDDEGAMTILCLSFYIMDEMAKDIDIYDNLIASKIKIDYTSRTFYNSYFNIYRTSGAKFSKIYKNIPDWKIGAILLPSVNFKIFDDIIGTPLQIPTLREVTKGLYTINNLELVHNDLHSGNIMIEEKTNKVLIYDWDRAYAKGLGKNKLLNDNTCLDLCKVSQCNLFLDKRPIDLIKILCYTIHDPDNFYLILKEVLNLENVKIGGISKFKIIRDGILKASNDEGSCFFVLDGCSSLYKPGHSMPLENAISYLGDWDIIFARAFPGAIKKKIRPAHVPKAKKALALCKVVLDASSIVGAAGGKFAFKKQKFGMLAVSPPRKHRRDEDDIGPVRKMYREGQFLQENENFGESKVKMDQRMVEEIRRILKFPISQEMKREIIRLQQMSVQDLTVDDFVILEKITDYIQYGPPVPIKMPVLKSAERVRAIPLQEIIQRNDARKIYPRRK